MVSSIRNIFIAAGILISSLILLSCADDNSTEYPVKISVYRGEACLLFYIADDQGYFQKHRLDVELREFPSGGAAFADMVSGDADFATASSSVVVTNHDAVGEIQLFSVIANAEICM